MAIKDSYYTITEAAKELGVSRQTVYRWIYDNKIQTDKIGGVILIEKKAVARHITGRYNDIMMRMLDRLAFDSLRQELGYTDRDEIEQIDNENHYVAFLVTKESGVKEKVLVGNVKVAVTIDRRHKYPLFSEMKLDDVVVVDYVESEAKKSRRRARKRVKS